jgi:protein-S-isoprenylcysteine O-methyltransferase Ste14
MWALVAAITAPWRGLLLYEARSTWMPAGALFCVGLLLYKLSHSKFTLAQLGGLPEILPGQNQQRLVTTGIRARVRHPVYLGHLCEMLAWSVGTGLAVCWALTGLAIVMGAVMIRMEDAELEKRFGDEYRNYRWRVASIFPRFVKRSRIATRSRQLLDKR